MALFGGLFGSDAPLLDQGLDAFGQRRWRKARELLEESSHEVQRPLGDYHLALLYWRGLGGPRDPAAAVYFFRRAADSGHAAAQTALGLALRAGVGAPKDIEAARALFRLAAGAGDVEAMTQLAAMSDCEEARRLLERAAERGHALAMRNLSDMLLDVDAIEALSWLYVSVGLSGDRAAAKRAKHLADEMTADEIAAAQKQGRRFLKRLAAERGR